jgi:signal transduction histidine kinase
VVVSVVGFVLTWYTVVDSLRPDAGVVGFVVGQAPVLVAGLGLTTYGVALAVSSRDRAEADLIARWCVAGAASMGVAVALTYAGAGTDLPAPSGSRLVANVLVGGAVGGTLTGVRSAATRRHRREATRKADRLTVLNRLLRHEVLNKVNVIEGYAAADPDDEAMQAVRRSAGDIGETVDQVRSLTGDDTPRPVPLAAHVGAAVETVDARHPDAAVETGSVPDLTVRGSGKLDALFEHLVESAVLRSGGDAPTVRVEVAATGGEALVRVADDGPPLSEAERRVVEAGVTPERDDPRSGFVLAVARLLAEDVDGRVDVETLADGGTALTVALPRADGGRGAFGAAPRRLRRAAVAALVAGAAMGLVAQFVTGKMVVIGALYGVENVAVGWVTHQFHSVCFGLWFVAATATWVRDSPLTMTALGVGYGWFLWFVAAGFVMPLWLQAVGVPATVPNLGLGSLAEHVLWGGTFGGVYGVLSAREWL